MRVKLQAKIILIGVGLSLLLMLVSVLVSYFVYRDRALANLHTSLDYCSAKVERYFVGDGIDPGLKELRDYIVEIYLGQPDDPAIDDPDDRYTYYREKYNDLYPVPAGMIGMSYSRLEHQNQYYTSSGELASTLSTMGVKGACIVYLDDERDRLIYLVDYDYRLGANVTQNTPFIGSYYTLREEDELAGSDWTLNGKRYKVVALYAPAAVEGDPAEYCATILIQYDESSVRSSVSSFFNTEMIAVAVSTAVLIAFYALMVYFVLIKNIKKLDGTTRSFTESVLEGGDLKVLDPDVRSRDELAELAKSFVTLEEEILRYTDRIAKDASEKERLNAELSIASQIQLEELPPVRYADDKVSLLASFTSAKEVGGDFYDYFYIDPTHVAVVIADVTGKGVPAALFMMKAKGLIKNSLVALGDIPRALAEVNTALLQNNRAGLFVTAFVGVIDLETRRMTCCSAGHERPYLVVDGKAERLDVNANFVLGGLPDFVYKSHEFDLSRGQLFLFTDGLNESINAANEEFDYHRIVTSLEASAGRSQEEVVTAMLADLKSFVGEKEPFDDVTILSVELPQGIHECYRDPDFEVIEKVTDSFNRAFAHLNGEDLARMDVVIDEVLNNLVSYEKHEGFVIKVDIDRQGDTLTMTFRSNGVPFDPLSVQQKYIESDDASTPLGGFGITIARSLCDLTYQRVGEENVLTAVKHLV